MSPSSTAEGAETIFQNVAGQLQAYPPIYRIPSSLRIPRVPDRAHDSLKTRQSISCIVWESFNCCMHSITNPIVNKRAFAHIGAKSWLATGTSCKANEWKRNAIFTIEKWLLRRQKERIMLLGLQRSFQGSKKQLQQTIGFLSPDWYARSICQIQFRSL